MDYILSKNVPFLLWFCFLTLQVQYSFSLMMMWSWFCLKYLEEAWVTKIIILLKEYFWMSQKIVLTYHFFHPNGGTFSIEMESGCHSFIHSEADSTVEPICCTVTPRSSLISTVNHKLTELLRLFAVLHISMDTAFTFFLVNDSCWWEATICGKYVVINIQLTVFCIWVRGWWMCMFALFTYMKENIVCYNSPGACFSCMWPGL